jgi:hypothetical protein
MWRHALPGDCSALSFYPHLIKTRHDKNLGTGGVMSPACWLAESDGIVIDIVDTMHGMAFDNP